MNKIAFAPTTDDLAVRVRGLRKVYRLYRNPSYRLRDILGLLPDNPRYFSEHVALHDVTLDIRRGEKVAIIGRNGAGKSTLLKLITRVIQPTAGTITLTGETQALLSLGAGFHPELTGRQNVLAYFANFGIGGERAARMLDDIIAFAELEEYIDQPTKTYSSGMNVRLMFAASTMFAPDLLVIDEVLGVGDAYFQGKSFERIREMCSGQGTTLLLVTHDVYTASSLCERMIWIDHGAVLLDAPSPTVLKAYETSIRQQEEARLRKKALLGAQRMVEMAKRRDVPMLIELRSPDNTPLPSPVAIARVAVVDGEREWFAALIDGADAATGTARLVTESGSWGDVVTWQGRQARQMKHYGSAIHKVGICFFLPTEVAARADQMRIEIELGSDHPCQLEAWRIDASMQARRVGIIPTAPGKWMVLRAALSGDTAEVVEALPQDTVDSAAAIAVEDAGSIVGGEADLRSTTPAAADQTATAAALPEVVETLPPQEAIDSAAAIVIEDASSIVGGEADLWSATPAAADHAATTTALPEADEASAEVAVPAVALSAPEGQANTERPVADPQDKGPETPVQDSNLFSAGVLEHHGSGRVVVTRIRFLDDKNLERLQLEHGKFYRIVLSYQINDQNLKEHCQIVFAFRRNGVDDMFRLFGKELLFDGSAAPQGEIVVDFDRMPIGVGEYAVTVLVAKENYYEERPNKFYTVNPDVYWAARDVIDIKVVSDHLMPQGTGVVGQASWYLR